MNRDIKKCIFYYIFTCHCLLWFLYSCYAKFLPISHLTAGKLLCCVFFCSPIVSLHVSASILISRQCNLSSTWGIQIFQSFSLTMIHSEGIRGALKQLVFSFFLDLVGQIGFRTNDFFGYFLLNIKIIQGVFLHWASPKMFKYGKPVGKCSQIIP